MKAQAPDLVPAHGPVVIGMLTFLSWLAVPLSASLAMLAGGAFGVAGDGNLFEAAGAALCGALLGDQVGFAIGRGATGQTLGRQVPRLLGVARARLERDGWQAVFLTLCLV